jgi:hypothetical protein
MKTSGVVRDTYTKEWTGRNGDTILLHSFQLDGDNKYYRTGERAVVNIREFVSFDYDGKGNVDVDSLEKKEAPAGGPPVSAPAQQQARSAGRSFGGGGRGKNSRDEYWDEKARRDIEIVEPRITWASATSDAIAIVTAALQHDLLSFGNANKSAKLGLLLDYVDQVTARLATTRYNAAEVLKGAIADQEGLKTQKAKAVAKEDTDLE